MYGVAIRMLLGDRSKYFAMVAGVAFASLIMTQQPSILIGLLSRTFSFIQDVSEPDIWVMDAGVQFVEENKPLRNTDLHRVRGISGVEWAVPLYKALMTAKLPDGQSVSVDVTGLDDATLVGAPTRLLNCKLEDLKRVDAVLVDQVAAETRLRITQPDGTTRPLAVGDTLEMNDHRAIVVGHMKASRSFVLQPKICTLYSRAQTYAPNQRRNVTYVLVKAREGLAPKDLAKRITQSTGLKALTADDFCDANLMYWAKNTGIPINFGTSVLLGFAVGAAVVGQTFLGFVQENLKHYAALRAMGLSSGVLYRMVMLQATCVGVIGYGIGVGMTTLFGIKSIDSVLAFRMMPSLLLYAGIGVLIIILLAALLGVRKLTRVDPSVVFRS